MRHSRSDNVLSQTPRLTPSMSESAWLDAFSMHLGELLPELRPTDAVAFARQTYEDASDLDPKEAAEIFALEMPPADIGAP